MMIIALAIAMTTAVGGIAIHSSGNKALRGQPYSEINLARPKREIPTTTEDEIDVDPKFVEAYRLLSQLRGNKKYLKEFSKLVCEG